MSCVGEIVLPPRQGRRLAPREGAERPLGAGGVPAPGNPSSGRAVRGGWWGAAGGCAATVGGAWARRYG